MDPLQPIEIAREALRRLAGQRIPPTPDNYRALYHEIAGTRPAEPFPVRALRHLAAGLPRPETEAAERFAAAVEAQSWSALEKCVADALCGQGQVHDDAPTLLRALLAELFEQVVATILQDEPGLADEVRRLAADLRGDAPLSDISEGVRDVIRRAQLAADDHRESEHSLLALLQLLLENIGHLVSDERWLHGQINVLRELLGERLDARRLEEVERRLRETVFQQVALQSDMVAARSELRSMLSGFVEHLASFGSATSGYRGALDGFASQIDGVKDAAGLTALLREMGRATRQMQQVTKESHTELERMRERTTAAEREIARLQLELSRTSEQMRHDQLTGAQNRKGLEESFTKEMARAKRRRTPLCLAVLDIDNFKRLNDTYGHQAGDDALVHLARTVRECLRPHDTLARYGGEEFVILLPETAVEVAVTTMQRLQRELTKRFFLAKEEKLLITFSCGVTAVCEGETQSAAIARADAAMYQAKQTGKNRVVAAPGEGAPESRAA